MNSKVFSLLVAGALWLAGMGVSAQVERPDRKVWDGIYTRAQAARGKERYNASCSRCHNVALIGSERGPAVKGNVFWSKWENDNLGSLFVLVRDTMPADGGAGVLTDDVKVDILAFLLEMGGYPAGTEELKLDLPAFEAIKITKKNVNDGVFSAAQAERGKAGYLSARCAGCHQLDLSGERGPALRGEEFLKKWENGTVNALFAKIRDTMPPNGADGIADNVKADIVAYLLQSNGFPEGAVELEPDTAVLETLEIVRKGATPGAPNFALVQVIGCLAPAAGNTWMLTNGSEPVVTRAEEPTPALLTAAQAKALGRESFQLISVAPFKPQASAGHKVEARGLIYRDGTLARLNLTSLKSIQPSCAN